MVAQKRARWLHNPYRPGVPTASYRGTKSEVAHKWAGWYTPPISIARTIDPSIGGIGARDEYWTGVHPSNFHREGYRPVDKGCRGTR